MVLFHPSKMTWSKHLGMQLGLICKLLEPYGKNGAGGVKEGFRVLLNSFYAFDADKLFGGIPTVLEFLI